MTYLDTVNFRTPRVFPKYPFHDAAQSAANFLRFTQSTEELTAQLIGKTDHEKLAALIERAWTPNPLALAAREALTELGAQGVRPTMAIIGQQAEEPQQAALAYVREVYQRTHDQACVRAILAFTESAYPSVWQDALMALREIDEPEVAMPLRVSIESQRHTDPVFLSLAIETIGSLGGAPMIPFLTTQLAHRDLGVSLAAADGLVAIGPSAVPSLLEQVTSPQRQVRLAAIHALVRIPDARSHEALQAFLNQYPDEDPDVLGQITRVVEPQSARHADAP